MTWNFDLTTALRGTTVTKTNTKGVNYDLFVNDVIIAASKCGKVMSSYWLPKENRWAGFASGEEPVAWMPWPEHPNTNPEAKASVDNAATIAPETATAGREMQVGAAPRGSVPATSEGGRDGSERRAPNSLDHLNTQFMAALDGVGGAA